jgi:hypothetical protein
MGGHAYRRVEMSKTVSFVAREELAEWLESRADAEMKTVSSVVQDIVAKEYRAQSGVDTDKSAGASSGPLEELPFTSHPEAWYEPNTNDPDEILGVRIPESAEVSEDRRYYKTYDGAAKAIKRWYE